MAGPYVPRSSWATRQPSWRQLSLPTPEAVQHHSAGPSPGQDLVGFMRAFEEAACNRGDGLIAIGYHRLIVSGGPHDGTRVETRPWGAQGGATLNHNSISHAIVITGNFENETPTEAALDSCAEEWAYAIRNGFVAANAVIQGHREMSGNSTACPGRNLLNLLPDLRNRVAQKVGSPAPPPPPPGPSAPPVQHPTIRRGSRGPSVQSWQITLNKIAGQGLATDGVFGPRTEEATKNFQRFFNLTVDGIVGPQTWGMADYIRAIKGI